MQQKYRVTENYWDKKRYFLKEGNLAQIFHSHLPKGSENVIVYYVMYYLCRRLASKGVTRSSIE